MSPLAGRAALVTGGASGIGAAVCRGLASRGAAVTVADIDGVAAAEPAAEIGGEAWTVDLTETEALADLTLNSDVLVNNAGFQHVAPIEEFDPAIFHRLLMLMVEAPFLLVRAALPHMYAQGHGRIVNVSSVHGLRASAHKSAYVASKHALEGLSKVTALEGAAHGVTSNCVNPGYVRTPLVDAQIAAQARDNGVVESKVVSDVLLAGTAIKRLVEPVEVARLVAYLVSDDAAMITGSSSTIDGGWSAR
ncbi:3-hydroxybutyrate dehydrogenase [Aeromicrobium sp.]|uniref:3-hydroxybutyrate dehydrogenase n=1 Tax=Aeromicrobium sp. TaxID=1871063 RepID=UPI00198AF3F3|nr:3-hydroxybutyrate dehydrogenase [Aeromicrobium sp.]MBC7630184.1 3-hydroxybutyrate dehydrogenase [Aeromicrobium sp.]